MLYETNNRPFMLPYVQFWLSMRGSNIGLAGCGIQKEIRSGMRDEIILSKKPKKHRIMITYMKGIITCVFPVYR